MLTRDDPKSKPLPFNLASLNPIHTDADTEYITDAIESGLAALKAQPNAYLDLPAFDAVRLLGEDYRPIEPESQIFILRWFDKQYDKHVRKVINTRLRARFGEKTKILTTIDSQSPELVEQRLYAAIRRTQLCILDWTAWRPNVFFEAGVRLAVNKRDPIFIRCTERPPGWDDKESTWPQDDDPSAQTLKEFFGPTEFTFENFEALHQNIDEFDEDNPVWRVGAKIRPGHTYEVIAEAINRHNEPGGRSVSDLLMFEANAMAGPAVPGRGRSSSSIQRSPCRTSMASSH